LLTVGTNTTTQAGGLVFGTDTGLWRGNAGRLVFGGTGIGTPQFWIASNSGNSAKIIFDNTNLTIDSGAGGNFNLQVAATTALTINSSRNVGIGTTTPTTNLQVNGTTATTTISATVVNGSTRSTTLGGRIILQDTSGGTCTEITTQSGVITGKAVTCP